MPSLILDKSAVVAARPDVIGALRARQFSFILTDTLLYEISTERLGDRATLRGQDARRLKGRLAANLAKAREAGDEWLERSEALRCEIVDGRSARFCRKLVMNQSFSLRDILDVLDEVGTECLRHDADMGRLASIAHAPEDDAEFRRIRRMDERSFFRYLESQLASPRLLEALPTEARSGFAEVAASHGLTVSPCFLPDRGWLAYGVGLANRAYLPWKFWRVGDEVADPRKPGNPFFDNLYIAFMAIGDGILSCDKDLLRLSWVCWPEKRGDILRFDTVRQTPEQFQPDWL